MGKVGGHLVYAGAMDMSFIGGSMGSAVGEKITRLIERALENRGRRCRFLGVGRRADAGRNAQPDADGEDLGGSCDAPRGSPAILIPVLTDPTTGGVTASFAMLGDVNLAEPKALIGFAGPRVIEQTIRQKLPKGFQCSEFLLEHGMVDQVVDRRKMKEDDSSSLRWIL